MNPRELVVTFADERGYFISEAGACRRLKAPGSDGTPAFRVMAAADEFKDYTTATIHLWQTAFTYLKVVGGGWFYVSTILDEFSRHVVAWKPCTTMKTSDVTQTSELALKATASGLDGAEVKHRPLLLSDNGWNQSRLRQYLRKWGGPDQTKLSLVSPGKAW